MYETRCSLHAHMQFTRSRCHCRCECFRMPNRRIPCTTCFRLIGPGCCATNHETGALTGICHCCSQANPQECDGVIKATTGLADEQCRGCGEEHLADEGRRFWQKEWRRITLAIKRRWQTARACTASNIRSHLKWTRILAERQAEKCSQAGEWSQAPQGEARRPPGVQEAEKSSYELVD